MTQMTDQVWKWMRCAADKYQNPRNTLYIHEIHELNMEIHIEIQVEIHIIYEPCWLSNFKKLDFALICTLYLDFDI